MQTRAHAHMGQVTIGPTEVFWLMKLEDVDTGAITSLVLTAVLQML